VLLLVVLLVLLAIAAWIGRESAIQFALSRLHHDAEAIVSNLDVKARRITGTIAPIYHQPLSGHYYLVRFGDGAELRSRSLWDEPFDVPARPAARPRYWLAGGPREQRLLIWERSFEKDGRIFTIAIAEDVAPLLSAIWRFVWIGVLASVGAVLLMLLAQRWLIRRAFARFDRIREEVREVRQGSREDVGTDVPAEVLPVVHEFNQLLRAWRAHQERSRNAVGNLAHALKTPLQLIMAEGAHRHDDRVTEQAKRMQELIEQELKRARLTGRAAVGRHFSPKEDLEALVETMATLYHRKALQIETDIRAPSRLQLDQGDLMELAGNLLDNAAKWARQRLRIELNANDSDLELVIEDDGPGIEEPQRRELLQRGSRLDENRPGHGLGLAIVREIVALYQGSIGFGRSSRLGGLRVEVVLPLV
jgi:signal transduction histidine kinase